MTSDKQEANMKTNADTQYASARKGWSGPAWPNMAPYGPGYSTLLLALKQIRQQMQPAEHDAHECHTAGKRQRWKVYADTEYGMSAYGPMCSSHFRYVWFM